MADENVGKKIELNISDLINKLSKFIQIDKNLAETKKKVTVHFDSRSLFDKYEFKGYKGTRTDKKKKNFQPRFINCVKEGNEIIRNTIQVINDISIPINANIYPINTFENDLANQ
jgi:hypothetical protein